MAFGLSSIFAFVAGIFVSWQILSIRRKRAKTEQDSINTDSINIDSIPIPCFIYNENIEVENCNSKILDLFMLSSKEEFKEKWISGFGYSISYGISDEQLRKQNLISRIKEAKESPDGTISLELLFNIGAKLKYINTTIKYLENKDKDSAIVFLSDTSDHHEALRKLEQRDYLLETVNEVATCLMSPKFGTFDERLVKCFERMGLVTEVNIVSIWKKRVDGDGNMIIRKLAEWSDNVYQVNNKDSELDYEKTLPSYAMDFLLGERVNSTVSSLPNPEHDFFRSIGVVSVLIEPIFVEGKFWGVIGYGDCLIERTFADVEVNILKSCSHLIVSAIIENENSKKLIEANEQAFAATRAKSEFLANMSHEIRTPMNVILGMSEIMMNEKLPDGVQRRVIDIKNASEYLLSIINDILDFSKIESGKLDIIEEKYHLSSLICDIANIISLRSCDKKLDFVVDIAPDMPSVLFGDEGRIRQILINLLTNAVKFTSEGHITLKLWCTTRDEFITLHCDVTDTGIGIRPEDMGKLFSSFSQADIKRNRNIEGTGLGLAITKRLTELMNGTVEVRSIYGKGSTFSVAIPQIVVDPTPIARVKIQSSVIIFEQGSIYAPKFCEFMNRLGVNCNFAQSCDHLINEVRSGLYKFAIISSKLYSEDLKKSLEDCCCTIVILADVNEAVIGENVIWNPMHCISIANLINGENGDKREMKLKSHPFTAPAAKVLVVDDVKMNIRVAAGLLKPYGVNIDIASSGAQAISAIERKEYDIVFMDHMMPEMDGVETVELIRAKEGEYFRNLPIIAFTANAMRGMREFFLEAGFSDFISKPIETGALSEILQKWIPEHKQVKMIK